METSTSVLHADLNIKVGKQLLGRSLYTSYIQMILEAIVKCEPRYHIVEILGLILNITAVVVIINRALVLISILKNCQYFVILI